MVPFDHVYVGHTNNKENTMQFTTQADTSGTSLQGKIEASYWDLVDAFGEPERGDDYKTQAEWHLKFADGTVVSVYDWKQSVKPQDVKTWNIGGFSIFR
jgi:hypothetical protein